jgi:hypothetical protein
VPSFNSLLISALRRGLNPQALLTDILTPKPSTKDHPKSINCFLISATNTF